MVVMPHSYIVTAVLTSISSLSVLGEHIVMRMYKTVGLKNLGGGGNEG